ncbi:LlaJI family restriction endonuclease [Pectobacterium odoriferum]|uniref:LlaJI family restriction endonuclease n=1 Tax=Pectobacterium odoriferum TaxID=78398 RepID=UPI000CD327E1|nr:LlaJI family restriction endonuclease [Pectobacterium odoriferum]POE02236.1 hypothetical protein BV916_15765 [Pectobacterium odoriferum]
MSKSDFTFAFYNDRSLLNSLPKGLYHSLKEKGLIPYGGAYVHFCGLITYENITAVFLPRNSKIDIFSKKTEIARHLLKSIQRYKSSADSATETADQGKEVIGIDSITLIVDLLDDFVLNGLYTRKTEEHTLNQGRADWKRTISQKIAYISGGSAFYPDVIGKKKLTDQRDVVTQIHAQVIREICRKAGWIAFSNPGSLIHELSSVSLIAEPINIQIALLTRELNISYSDRDVFLLKSLIQYLGQESGYKHNELVIGIRECHGFWERMLDSCLIHKENINHRMLAPLYKISGNYVLASSKGHRTDTVLKHPTEKNYVIVDAKYYGAHDINSSPKLADIVKQFYYAKAVSIIEKDIGGLVNVFIFPGQSGDIESIHMAKKGQGKLLSNSDCLDTDYPPIQCIYQDPIELLEHYSKGLFLKALSDKLIELSVNS